MSDISRGKDFANFPSVDMTSGKLQRWFDANGGKHKAGVTKPMLDDDKKEARMKWVEKIFQLMESGDFYIAFLDEKWRLTETVRETD